MASSATTAVAPELGVEGLLDPPSDLRELWESVTSLGSFALRWQMFESARRLEASA